MTVKGLMNGARLPNWFWIAMLFGGLGVQAGVNWSAQSFTVRELKTEQQHSTEKLVNAIAKVAERDSIRTTEIQTTLERRTKRINEELHEISRRTGYIARQVE